MRFTTPKPCECNINLEDCSMLYQLGIPEPGDEQGDGSILFSRPSTGGSFEIEIPVTVLRRIMGEHRDAMGDFVVSPPGELWGSHDPEDGQDTGWWEG